MTDLLRGKGLLPESHLLPDVVVAFVDGELPMGARERAASHIAGCPCCAAEVMAQRQARKAVKDAGAPCMSAGFLASLRAIPEQTELPMSPDNLAMTEDGQLVAIQRPDKVAGLRQIPGGFGSSAPLGSSASLGNGSAVLGSSHRSARRRAAQGAGVVVSGLVLSALAIVATGSSSGDSPRVDPQPQGGVLRAQLGTQPSPSPVTTSVSSPAPASDHLVPNR
jgi:anti-sigma factor RsiW